MKHPETPRTGLIVLAGFLVSWGVAHGQGTGDIRHVRNSEPSWDSGAEWTLSGPVLEIGSLMGEPEYRFARVADGKILSDGSLVVADNLAMELRVYDAAGVFVRSIGRKGEGPGEFGYLGNVVALPGDTLLAWDPRLRRFTTFDPTGALVRTAPVDWRLQGSLYNAQQIRPGLMALMMGWSSARLPDAERRPGLLFRDSLAVIVVNTQGDVERQLGPFPGIELVVTDLGGGRRRISEPPYSRVLQTCAASGVVVVGTQETMAYDVFSGDGAHLMRVTAPTPALDLDDDWKEAYWRKRTEMTPDIPTEQRQLRLARESMTFPPERAAYGDLRCGRDGHVWLRESAQRPGEVAPGSWLVFSPEGQWLGSLDVPRNLKVLDINGDRLLGLWKGEYDVDYLRVYGIRR